jgi:hypothetical protein
MEQRHWPDGTFKIDQSVTEAALFFSGKKQEFFLRPSSSSCSNAQEYAVTICSKTPFRT